MVSIELGAPLWSQGCAARVPTALGGGCQAARGLSSACPHPRPWPHSARTTPTEPALDSPTPATNPGLGPVDELLEELERHLDHRHTIALHDALYGLKRALVGGGEAAAVADALAELARAARLEHPLRSALLAALGLGEEPPERSLEAILAAEAGVPLREDPLEALELHLKQRGELIHLLEERQRELVRNLERSSRHLEIAAGAAVLLFLLGGLGWAMAMDWLSVVDEPTIEERGNEEQDDGRAPEGRRKDRSR